MPVKRASTRMVARKPTTGSQLSGLRGRAGGRDRAIGDQDDCGRHRRDRSGQPRGLIIAHASAASRATSKTVSPTATFSAFSLVRWCPVSAGAPSDQRMRLGRLGTDLVDQVERRLGRAPEPGEAGVGDDLPDRGLSGLRAERVAAGLGQRVRHAQQRWRSCSTTRPTGFRLPATLSAAKGSTISQVPSGLSAWRTCRAAPSGSPMSCRQSKVAARS